MNGKKVLVGLSGGVDSSVAAAILVERGFEVIGVTLKLYDYAELDFEPPDGGCCTIDLINDARSVCAQLGIPHYLIDLRKAFQSTVIDDFIDSYSRGRTPNPCINCNRYIKWDEMLKSADKLECEFIATGHYARIAKEGNETMLLKAVDNAKDQSYALWGIPLKALQRTLLPVGDFSKPDIREKAKALGFINADRPDSQEICFVPAGDYAAIVHKRRGENDRSLQPGLIYDTAGQKLGEHKGYAYYTIGQRKGFGISAPHPLYVIRINPDDKSIVVGSQDDLFSSKLMVNDLNWLIKRQSIPQTIDVKIRYKHQGSPARINLNDEGADVEFIEPQRAITPGQSAVFYDGIRVIGGGIIERVLN